jgi:hypothetical protein
VSEPLTRLLADLPGAEPDPARAERTRMRCHARLEGLRASAAMAPSSGGSKVHLWQPVLAVLGVAYVADAIVLALRAYGMR